MDTLDDTSIAYVANYFQALSEPSRLKLMNALRGGERKVGELAAQLACSPANASKHLGLLAKSGLVARHTRGNCVYYRIADPAVFALCDLVCGQVGRRLSEQLESAVQLVAVQDARATPAAAPRPSGTGRARR